MQKQVAAVLALLAVLGLGAPMASAQVDAATQAAIDAQRRVLEEWASNPIVVNAVKAKNASTPAADKAMTQERWEALKNYDEYVLSFVVNPVGRFLKASATPAVSEAFVSAADGTKVGFRRKPSNWSHKGKPKHDDPMRGRVWQGEVETDDSTGLQQIQVAVPVLDGGTPIGSLVAGLQLARLK